jgi:shikimate kinase
MVVESPQHIVLIGFMGSGKSSVARFLAEQTELGFIDMDSQIEQDSGMSISRIFELEGEEGFRRRESELLESLLDRNRSIVSTGGGVVIREQNRRLLRQLGTVVYLQVSIGEADARLKWAKDRPLLRGLKTPEQLLTERLPWYQEVADITVDTNGKGVRAVTEEVYERLRKFNNSGC